jgi:hypothetical protein
MYTWSEVQRHVSPHDCWTVIDRTVYDVSRFVDEHPGGSIILKAAGVDATMFFHTAHWSSKPSAMLAQFRIGVLRDPAGPPLEPPQTSAYYDSLKELQRLMAAEYHAKRRSSGALDTALLLLLGAGYAAWLCAVIRGSLLGAFLLGFCHNSFGTLLEHGGGHGSHFRTFGRAGGAVRVAVLMVWNVLFAYGPKANSNWRCDDVTQRIPMNHSLTRRTPTGATRTTNTTSTPTTPPVTPSSTSRTASATTTTATRRRDRCSGTTC